MLKNNLVTFLGASFRSYGVVPFPMKVMRKHVDGGELRIGDFESLGYFFSSSSARTVRPASVVVAAISSTIVRKLRRGLPRQLMLMKEKSRCSILFHLLVPGGKWHTVIGNFSSSANFWSSIFHRRTRLPFDPPPSAV